MPSSSSTTDHGRALPERVLVGTVLRPHGIRGAVVVEVHSDNPIRFAPGRELDMVARDGEARRVRIEAASRHGRWLRVQLAGVTSRDQAAALAGARFEVTRAEVPRRPQARSTSSS